MPTRGKHKNRQHKHTTNNKSYAAVHRTALQRSSGKLEELTGNHKVILSFAQNHVEPSVLKKLKANKFIGSQVTHRLSAESQDSSNGEAAPRGSIAEKFSSHSCCKPKPTAPLAKDLDTNSASSDRWIGQSPGFGSMPTLAIAAPDMELGYVRRFVARDSPRTDWSTNAQGKVATTDSFRSKPWQQKEVGGLTSTAHRHGTRQ